MSINMVMKPEEGQDDIMKGRDDKMMLMTELELFKFSMKLNMMPIMIFLNLKIRIKNDIKF